ncbi:hypothetical protein C7M51_04428 (plasmid) [Mixta intestinalis]|uniref:Uncharacterized protein n=1 Tax=Mixta intestinalis TaxID=1615494 RepID=A0A6P1Q7Q6_9GAMM|nr:hypothetical protein C7M51_04428 [Mixta intestinalis]
MATACSIMCRYGMNIFTAAQHMDINAYMKSDPRMPGTRLRGYPGQYGQPSVTAPVINPPLRIWRSGASGLCSLTKGLKG